MNKFMNVFFKLSTCLAFLITLSNVNEACFLHIHQEELPKGADRLKKF